MSTSPRTRRSADEWATLIAEQADSGCSQQSFCREAGVSVTTFQYWKRKLRRQAGEERRPEPPSFAEIALDAPENGHRGAGPWDVELELGGAILRMRCAQ